MTVDRDKLPALKAYDGLAPKVERSIREMDLAPQIRDSLDRMTDGKFSERYSTDKTFFFSSVRPDEHDIKEDLDAADASAKRNLKLAQQLATAMDELTLPQVLRLDANARKAVAGSQITTLKVCQENLFTSSTQDCVRCLVDLLKKELEVLEIDRQTNWGHGQGAKRKSRSGCRVALRIAEVYYDCLGELPTYG